MSRISFFIYSIFFMQMSLSLLLLTHTLSDSIIVTNKEQPKTTEKTRENLNRSNIISFRPLNLELFCWTGLYFKITTNDRNVILQNYWIIIYANRNWFFNPLTTKNDFLAHLKKSRRVVALLQRSMRGIGPLLGPSSFHRS